MNYDVSKAPPQNPEYVVERTISASPMPKKKKNPFEEPVHQADNFGGLFVTATGTANTSLASPSAPPDEYIYFIPDFGPIAETEMERQQVDNNMELAKQISPKNHNRTTRA